MSTSRDAASSIALTRVKAGREQEFEAFVRDVIAPSVARARPHLAGLWQVLRPSEDESRDGGVYAFVFYGDVPDEDWELDRLFADVHGNQQAVRLGRRFDDLVVGEQDVYTFSGEVSAA